MSLMHSLIVFVNRFCFIFCKNTIIFLNVTFINSLCGKMVEESCHGACIGEQLTRVGSLLISCDS